MAVLASWRNGRTDVEESGSLDFGDSLPYATGIMRAHGFTLAETFLITQNNPLL